MTEGMMLVFCLRGTGQKERREKQDNQENRGLPSGAPETQG